MALPNSAIVIGSGIAGSACAYLLGREGVATTVICAEDVGGEATRVAPGMLQPVTGRRARLAPWHREGFEWTLGLARRLEGSTPVLRPLGVLRAALDNGQADLWRSASANLDPAIACWIGPDEAEQRCGAMPHGCRGGIWIGGGGIIDTAAFTRALLAAGRCTVMTGTGVISFRVHDAGVEVRVEGRGTLSADTLVLAAGVGTNALLDASGLPPVRGLVPAGGVVIELNTDASPRCVVSSGGYLVPRPGGVVVGATFDERSPWEGITRDAVVDLEGRARRLLPPGTTMQLARARSGVRPATKDRVPRVGPHPDAPAIRICTGLGAKGLLLGPLAALMLVNQLARRDDGPLPPARWTPTC